MSPEPGPPGAPPADPDGRVPAWLRRVVDVRPDELVALTWSFLYFFFLLASYYVLRPLRDDMAITGGVGHLQWLFTATLGAMLLAVPAWSALAARLPRRRLIPIVYRFFLLNLVAFYLVLQFPAARTTTARVFFVWTSVFNLFVVSVFWSFMADIFQREQGKRLFGFISAGGSAGAIAGPLVTSLLVHRIGPVNLLLLAAGLLELASQCVRRLAPDAAATTVARPDADHGTGGGTFAAARLLVRSPYLAGIATYVLLLMATGTIGYMLQARLVAAQNLDSAGRTALFARIDLAVSVGAALTQAFLAGRILDRMGVGVALALAPVVTAATSIALAVAPRLSVMLAANGLRRVVEYAVSKPGREVLFTVVSREEKYKPKALIDTVVHRGGDAASSWAFAAIANQGASIPVLSLAALPFAAAWLLVARYLARRLEQR